MATNRFFDNTGLTVTDGALAKASQLNTLISETNKAFEVVAAEMDVIAASQSLANRWANEDQGIEVDPIANPGQYSAKAHTEEAEAWASGTGGIDTKADGVTTIPYSAKEKAEEANADAALVAADKVTVDGWVTDIGGADQTGNTDGWRYDSQQAAAAAALSEAKANEWAEKATEVEPGEYSAKKHAGDAAVSSGLAAAAETNAQLRAWEAEAHRKTAEEYAMQDEDVFVNIWTSDGDGTFTATPSTDYSAKHWQIKSLAAATPPAVGSSTFAGDGNTKTVAHGLPGAPSGVTVTAKADPAGYLGEIWVTWDATNLYVGNSGSFTGAFTYVAYR